MKDKNGFRVFGSKRRCPDCGQDADSYKYCEDCRERRLQKIVAEKDKRVRNEKVV